jgi:hypothetical protein
MIYNKATYVNSTQITISSILKYELENTCQPESANYLLGGHRNMATLFLSAPISSTNKAVPSVTYPYPMLGIRRMRLHCNTTSSREPPDQPQFYNTVLPLCSSSKNFDEIGGH